MLVDAALISSEVVVVLLQETQVLLYSLRRLEQRC